MKDWWTEWLEKLERKLFGWGGLHLTLMGRICVLNIFWLPKTWYLARQMDLPDWVIKKIECIIRGWVWKKKHSQIDMATLQGTLEEGGLGLVNIRKRLSALRAALGQLLWSSRDQQLRQVLHALWRSRYQREGDGRPTVVAMVRGNLQASELRYNGFWKGIVSAWRKARRTSGMNSAARCGW